MGVLGAIFTGAAANHLTGAGMSQDNVIEGLVGHMSNVGDVTTATPRRGGPGGMG